MAANAEKIQQIWESQIQKNTSSLNFPPEVKGKIDNAKLPPEFASNPNAEKAFKYGLMLSYECLSTRSNLSAFLKTCMTEPSRDLLTDMMKGKEKELTINDSVTSPFSLFQTNIFPHELQK